MSGTMQEQGVNLPIWGTGWQGSPQVLFRSDSGPPGQPH
jgi:hypothetical protein